MDKGVVYAIRTLGAELPTARSSRREMSALAHELLRLLARKVISECTDFLRSGIQDAGPHDDIVYEHDDGQGPVFKDADGRPWVRGIDRDGANLSASISHSRHVIAVALATRPGISVGIDIEYKDARRPVADMAEQLLLPRSTSPDDFYQAWCRYEAVFKATGIIDPQAQKRVSPIEEHVPKLPADFAGHLVVTAS
ncbi:4'-phosphopantetheinyl transferase family protein [Thalassospira sp. MIT1370]|uniref:4'-phosphopantetheinyl transferase family protein n=1 Tax=unclassified Thalassospira TaxID=2648997 RepID=UPI00399A9527